MINNKRGLSGVIVTLITVLLAIVAIGIIWVVISGILDSNVESIDTATMCQSASMSIERATWDGNSCVVYVKRLLGGESTEIDGIVAINSTMDETDITGNVLDTKSLTFNCGVIPESLSVKAYFNDPVTGEAKYCGLVSTGEIETIA